MKSAQKPPDLFGRFLDIMRAFSTENVDYVLIGGSEKK
jgi:hypothetical protein